MPQPVAALDGELVVEVGGRHCDLLTWVDGRVLRPGRGLGPGGAGLLGEAIGRIHAFAERWQPPPGAELPRWDYDGLLTAASPYRPRPVEPLMPAEGRRLFREVAARAQEVFELLDRYERSTGIIHADFILLNCHFAGVGRARKVGIVDFDDLGWGYFLYDLCPLLGNLADFPGYRARRDAFLAGYRGIRDVPCELEVHLPVLMAARHAAACLWATGIDRGEGRGVPVRQHVAIRLELMRACLELT